MESVTLWEGAVYRHREPTLVGPLACPVCGTPPGAPRRTRTRTVEHPDADQPTYLVVRVGQYPCAQPACPRKYFTPPLVEAAPYAHTSRRLQQSATAVYRQGRAPLRTVAAEFQTQWHTRTGKSSVLRWHQTTVAQDYPRPERLPFSDVLCIDEVYDRVQGQKRPLFTCVDPLAGITLRIPVERADAEHLAAAMEQVRALAALTRAWELIADSIVAEAIQLRNDLRAVLNTSTTRAEARAQFDQLRQSWPARFQPWTWRPGTPLEPPRAPATEGPTGLRQ